MNSTGGIVVQESGTPPIGGFGNEINMLLSIYNNYIIYIQFPVIESVISFVYSISIDSDL